MPGTKTSNVTSTRRTISTSSWPTPTVSTMTTSRPAPSSSIVISLVARASTQLAARASARTSPPRIFRATSDILGFALEQLPRDHQALDLAGALADGAQLHVAIEFLDRIVLGEAVAAVDLQRFVRRAD